MEGRIPARQPKGAAPELYHQGVSGVWRRYALPLRCLAAALVLAVAAVVDHRWKEERINRAEVAEWYCSHDGTRCGGPSSRRIEAHWNERQLGYELGTGTLAGVALVAAGLRARRR